MYGSCLDKAGQPKHSTISDINKDLNCSLIGPTGIQILRWLHLYTFSAKVIKQIVSKMCFLVNMFNFSDFLKQFPTK